MAKFQDRYPLNVPGKYYIDAQCTDCDLCRECAPTCITRDDRFGHSYVSKQPETEEEIAMVQFGVEGCPTEGVGKDGDQFDWDTTPITDWNEIARRYHTDVSFELKAPVVSVQWD
jgi:ferredoxin